MTGGLRLLCSKLFQGLAGQAGIVWLAQSLPDRNQGLQAELLQVRLPGESVELESLQQEVPGVGPLLQTGAEGSQLLEEKLQLNRIVGIASGGQGLLIALTGVRQASGFLVQIPLKASGHGQVVPVLGLMGERRDLVQPAQRFRLPLLAHTLRGEGQAGGQSLWRR